MSRKKIKKHTNKKKQRFNPLVYQMMKTTDELTNKRQKEKNNDANIITDLIVDDKLNLEELDNYKYIKSVATELNWSASRLFKAIEFAGVKEQIKNEKELNENN